MPWVEFTAAFDFRIKPTVWISYKAATRHLVKQDCAELAIAAGKAIAISRDKDDDNAAG